MLQVGNIPARMVDQCVIIKIQEILFQIKICD